MDGRRARWWIRLSTWAMMVLGFGMMAWSARWREQLWLTKTP